MIRWTSQHLSNRLESGDPRPAVKSIQNAGCPLVCLVIVSRQVEPPSLRGYVCTCIGPNAQRLGHELSEFARSLQPTKSQMPVNWPLPKGSLEGRNRSVVVRVKHGPFSTGSGPWLLNENSSRPWTRADQPTTFLAESHFVINFVEECRLRDRYSPQREQYQIVMCYIYQNIPHSYRNSCVG
jgi:hypothetical protein